MASAKWDYDCSVLGSVLAAGFGGVETHNPYRSPETPETVSPEARAAESKIAWQAFDRFMVDFVKQHPGR
jgi:hypothetical protein